MVCDRCKMVVTSLLKEVGIVPKSVELGVVELSQPIGDKTRCLLHDKLESYGFELLSDKRERTVERIRTLIIDLVYQQDSCSNLKLSSYLVNELHVDYSALSKLFSEVTGSTVENYYMRQRVERIKELLSYDELSLAQIAVKMNYSSAAYLSSQFKQITGITPSAFKKLRKNERKSLDQL